MLSEVSPTEKDMVVLICGIEKNGTNKLIYKTGAVLLWDVLGINCGPERKEARLGRRVWTEI